MGVGIRKGDAKTSALRDSIRKKRALLDTLHEKSKEAAMSATSISFKRALRGTVPLDILSSVYRRDHKLVVIAIHSATRHARVLHRAP